MKILVYGINYSPELTGIGKYTGEMVEWMAFCDFMYESIATDLGADDAKRKSRLIRVSLDGANSWWSWNGTEEDLEECIGYAQKMATGILKL